MRMAHTNYISTMIKETTFFVNSATPSDPPPLEASPTHREFETLKENFNTNVGKANSHFLSEVEKREFGAVGRKLPRLKLGRGGDGSTRRTQHGAPSTAVSKKKVDDDDDPELAKAEAAKDKAVAEAKRLGEEARTAQLEVQRLTRELEELKREQATATTAEEANTQRVATVTATAPGGKRWGSEKLTVRFDNKVLKPSDYTMDVQDKGSKIAINLHIKGATKPPPPPPP